jgi:hypothetical protein
MRKRHLFVLLLFVSSCNESEKSTIDLSVEGVFLRGDFNGDDKYEYAWVQLFKYDSLGNCEPSCEQKVVFSDPFISEIKTGRDYYGGSLWNQGDLNKDGADEISLIPFGDASEWSYCALYSFQNGKWFQPIEPFTVYGTGGDYIDQDSIDPEYIYIHSSEYDNERGITGEKIRVRMRK